MSALHKLRVILGANKSNVPLFIAVLLCIYAGINGHPSLFVTPPVLMAVFLKQIQDLQTAQGLVLKGPVGEASARNVLRDVAFISAEALRVYLQGLCDQVGPDQAMTLIQAAGMKAAAERARRKPLLGVKLTEQPGSVLATANVTLLDRGKKRKFFNWSYSVDGGKSWVAVPSTVDAHTTITGLPLLTLCGFRVSVTNAAGQTEWTPTVTLLVH